MPHLKLRRRSRHFTAQTVAGLLALSLSLTPPALHAESFSENDLLLLDFTMDGQVVAQSVTAYSLNNTVVVSLAEAAAALEFPIEVNAANGTASGWFIDKNRRFELDINARTVTIEGKTQPLAATDAVSHDQAIYVPLKVFSRWFPADLNPELTTLSIKVASREQLPFQMRAARRGTAGQRFITSPAVLPETRSPYRFIGPHTADISLSYNTYRNTEPRITSPQTRLNHSELIRGELAYMTSSIFVSGNDDKTVRSARLKLSREQPDTPSGIKLIEVGDITPLSLIGGVSQFDMERGLLVSGDILGNSGADTLDGNKTRISGDVLQGWEVELLQNGVRIDYQIPGAEGHYDFRDLTLYGGANTFDLIFYGPAGERRTETITRFGGADAIHKGALSYQFSASQKGKILHEKEFDPTLPLTDRGTGRYGASLSFGLFSNLSVNSTWNSVMEDGKRLNYYGAGFSAGWRYLSLSMSATVDPLGGTIRNAVINTPVTMTLWGFNTQFQHTEYATSVIAKDKTSNLQITSQSSLFLSGAIGEVASRFGATHYRLLNSSLTNYLVDLSIRTDNTRIGNSLYYQTFNDPGDPNKAAAYSGALYFNSKLDPLSIRGSMSYLLKPAGKATKYELQTDVPIADDMGMYFGLEYTPSSSYDVYTAGLNWQLKYVTLAPRLSYDSNGTYTGIVYASFSLSPRPNRPGILMSGQPMTGYGAVASRVFQDIDGDGKFSKRDKPIPNATLRATQLYRSATTDAHGTAYLTGLAPGRATDIQLDQASLPDIAMTATHAGNSVRSRPAHWEVINFPVVNTGEIDGKIYQRRGDKLIPQPGMIVELHNTNGDTVAFKVSAQDGFFVFDRVTYGQYTITLSEENKDRLTHAAPGADLNQETPYQSGIELVITPPTASTSRSLPLSETGASEPIAPIVPPQEQPALPPAPAPDKDIVDISPPPPIKMVAVPHMLQLGIYSHQGKAVAAISQLHQRYGNPLEGLELRIERTAGAQGPLYHVQAIGNLDATEANARCLQLSQLGQSCRVLAPKTKN